MSATVRAEKAVDESEIGSESASSSPTPPPVVDDRLAATGPRRTVSPSQRPPGSIFAGRFEVYECIGKGSMGLGVYRAWDRKVGEEVALKFVPISTPEEYERASRELRGARRIGHPNVARVYGLHIEGDQCALSMEYVKGPTLEQVLREAPGRLPFVKLVRLAHDLLSAVEAIHDHRILHRDIKPANIIVRDGRAVILDFGCLWDGGYGVAVLDPDGNFSTPRDKQMVGTPNYMPLEQFCGTPLSRASDLFPVALILFEAATGESFSLPPNAKLLQVAASRHEPPTKFPRGATPIRRSFRRAILRCLAQRSEERLQSARDFLKAVGPVDQSEHPVRDYALRNRRGVIAGLVLAVAVLVTYQVRRVSLAAASANMGLPGAVYGFSAVSNSPEENWLSIAMGELLQADLEESGGLHLLPREVVATMKNDLGLGEGPPPDEAMAKRAALHTPVSDVIEGTVAVDQGVLTIAVSVREATTGVVRAQTRASGKAAKPAAVLEQAAIALRRALKLPPMSQDDLEAAREMLPHGEEALHSYAQGLSKLRAYEFESARRRFEAVLEREPTHAPTFAALAQINARIGDEEAARKHWALAESNSTFLPRDQKLAISAGHLEALGEPATAAGLYQPVVQRDPKSVVKNLMFVRLLGAAGEIAKAEAALLALAKLLPSASNDPGVLLARAHLRYLAHDDAEALKISMAAVAKAQERGALALLGQAYLSAGRSLSELGRFAEARLNLELARRNFELERDAAEELAARVRMAELLEDEGRFSDALRAYDAASNDAEKLRASGLASWTLGRGANCAKLVGELAGCYRRADKLLAAESSQDFVSRASGLTSRANCKLMAGLGEEARRDLDALEALFPPDSKVGRVEHDALVASAQSTMGASGAALAFARRAMAGAETTYERSFAATTLGILLAETGAFEEAFTVLKNAPVNTSPSRRDEVEVARAYAYALAADLPSARAIVSATDAAWRGSERLEVALLGAALEALTGQNAGPAVAMELGSRAGAIGLHRVAARIERATSAGSLRTK